MKLRGLADWRSGLAPIAIGALWACATPGEAPPMQSASGATPGVAMAGGGGASGGVGGVSSMAGLAGTPALGGAIGGNSGNGSSAGSGGALAATGGGGTGGSGTQPGGQCAADPNFSLYLVGNSLSDQLVTKGRDAAFSAFGQQYGVTFELGYHLTWGAPLEWNYEHKNEGSKVFPGSSWEADLASEWDAISLQPYDRPLESDGGQELGNSGCCVGDRVSAAAFMDYAAAASPNARFYVFAHWPLSNSGGTFLTDWSTPAAPNNVRNRAYFEGLLSALREDRPAGSIWLVPVGHAIANLVSDSGINAYAELYDDETHLNEKGAYVEAMVFIATLLRCNPTGMPAHQAFGAVNAEFAGQAQAAAWKAVTQNSALTGVSP